MSRFRNWKRCCYCRRQNCEIDTFAALCAKILVSNETWMGRDVFAPATGLTLVRVSSQIVMVGRRKRLPMYSSFFQLFEFNISSASRLLRRGSLFVGNRVSCLVMLGAIFVRSSAVPPPVDCVHWQILRHLQTSLRPVSNAASALDLLSTITFEDPDQQNALRP